jgi:L-malate glycosyltransferase
MRRNLLFNTDKAITINKGHDVDWYNDITQIDLKELGVPDDAFKIVCVANVRPMKGMKYLLQAAQTLNIFLYFFFIKRDNGYRRFHDRKTLVAVNSKY